MEFCKLYDEENRNILFSMSWLNKNSVFDKSIGSFEDIDLFTFLENIHSFNYEKDIFYDDIYYIVEYTKDSIFHLINNINKEIKREHKIVPISQAKEFDKQTILWLSRQDGRNIKEKLRNNKIKAVKRYKNVDTYENRIFKIFLKKLLLIEENRKQIQSNGDLVAKIRQWLRSDDAKNINEYGNIVYNNILLHHPHYSKIFKSYKWLNRLDEKVEFYSISYSQQLKTIIKFEILTQLQFLTTEAKILPNTLNNDNLKNFDININSSIIKIDLEKYISQINENALKKKLSFKSIRKFTKWLIEKQIKIQNITDRFFYIDTNNTNKVFIDLFRLFPIMKIDTQIVNFPITLLQKIEGKIVNANNTKVINLNHEIYTLPEILKTYDINILKSFLEIFEKYFKDKQINYIIPDYVNIFKFSSVKKNINIYFPNSRNIPKSILAGLQHLFDNNLKKDDTLIYIQKNHNNDLYVTPLLVKYDKSLQNITNGLYLEKHPTKKLKEDSDILDELNQYFNPEISYKLLSKFLQNGIKGIKKDKVAFYLNDKLIYLKDIKKSSKTRNRINQIQKLFTNKKLFKKDFIEIKDNNEDNLQNFAKLLEYEKDGFILWKEHLPKLSMGNVLMPKGYFDEFILVDDDSEVINGKIKVKEHFAIPSGMNELVFPLIFGDENINFEAYINSSEMPFKEDVECELKLTYNYEAETPYELKFIPINKQYKPLNVEWKEIRYKKCENLPIPNYPEKNSWEDFTRDPKRDGTGYSDLLDWILERLVLLENLDEVPKFIIEKELKKAQKNSKTKGYFQWGKYDKNDEYFCFVEVDGEKVFCHSRNFKEYININEFYEGMIFYLKVKENTDGSKIGQAITFKDITDSEIISNLKEEYLKRPLKKRLQPIIKAIQSIKYPLLRVWNNHSLSDMDVPDYFRDSMLTYINLSIRYMNNKNLPIEFKKELFNFLSHLHQDMPIQIANTLLKYSTDLHYSNNLALSIGNANLEWQEQILNNIFKHFDKYQNDERVFDILAIALWRSETLINKISQKNIERIIYNLLFVIKKDFKTLTKECNNRNLSKLVKKIELLLGILRARNNFNFLCPHEVLTLQYIKQLDKIIKYIIDNKINIKTRIQLDIVKPEVFINVPNIFYALRVYLTADTGAANSIKVLGVTDD
jgi:hypothetical protein